MSFGIIITIKYGGRNLSSVIISVT